MICECHGEGGPMLQQRNLTLVFWIVCAPWRGNETFSFRNKSCKGCILSSQRDYWQIYLEISPVSRIVGPVLFLMTLPTVFVKHPQRAINRNSLSTAHLSIASTPVWMYVQYLQPDCIPVGCVPPARWPYLAACSAGGGLLLRGVCSWGGSAPGGLLLGVVSQHALRQTHPS